MKYKSEILYCSLQTLNKLIEIKEKEKLEKEKIEKEYIKEELVNINTMFIPIDFSFFDFFDSFLSKLFNIDLKALLIDINTSDRISIASQSS